jgi:TolA-binding protein
VRARLGDHRGTLADISALGEGIATLDPALRAALELDHGLALVALGESDDARAPLASAMRIASPCRPLAAAELARLALESDRLEEAASALDQLETALAEATPGDRAGLDERARYMRALVAARSGNHAAAAEILRTLLAEHGQGSLTRPARLLLGESLVRSGAPAEAAERLADLLAEDATLPEATRDAVRLRIGEAWAAAGRWIESERAYADFVRDRAAQSSGEGHPLASQARFGIGWAREQRGAFDEAIIAYREVTARSEDATAARAQFQIGECLFAQGKVDEAIRELLKVEILYAAEEWSAAALFEAGRCYASLGRHADARAQWTRLRDQYATTRWAALAQAELDRASADSSAASSTTSTAPLPGR